VDMAHMYGWAVPNCSCQPEGLCAILRKGSQHADDSMRNYEDASCFNRAIGMDFATGGGLNKMVEILVVQLDLLRLSEVMSRVQAPSFGQDPRY
jgi:hypothetical protein